jgi:hypothetical protein
MTQTPCLAKSKVEIILDIGHLDLAPRITIILFVHSLHLIRMAIWILIDGSSKRTSPSNVSRMQGTFSMQSLL